MVITSKFKKIMSVAVILTLLTGLGTGCGSTPKPVAEATEDNADDEKNTESASEESAQDSVSDTEVTAAETGAAETETTETDAPADSTFGLKDFDGFYYTKVTEEMDGFDYTYIYGYRLNPDGTGILFGQDEIEITWNETEIHTPFSVYNFDCEPGKLIVHEDNGDVEYAKLTGNFIKPNPYNVDVNTVDEGTFPAWISKDGISENDGKLLIMVEIYTEDTYDIVDIGMMAPGDILYIDGQLLEVSTIDTNEYGLKEINGGIEEGGTALMAYDGSNCYVFAGLDDMSTYTSQGIAALYVNPEAVLIDERDPSEVKEYSYSEIKGALEELLADYPLTMHNCTIEIKNHEITEIYSMYTP